IRKLVDLNHGEIDKLEIRDATGGSVSATLVVRVPASGLENALAEFKKVAVRTEREQVSTRDVSRDFYDNEAHMRNLRAEEQQYLLIMKQAHTVRTHWRCRKNLAMYATGSSGYRRRFN